MIEHDDFIEVYENVAPEGYCQHLIDQFELIVSKGAGSTRIQSENAPGHLKSDTQLGISLKGHNIEYFMDHNPVDGFFDLLQQCFNRYKEKYSILEHCNLRATHMKMQKTNPGEGYHIWHFEQGPGYNANRAVVYLMYLNTLDQNSAGETEFLYQRRRIAPVENTMVLWPASYTHTHRGNVVHGTKPKYVVTGWFYID